MVVLIFFRGGLQFKVRAQQKQAMCPHSVQLGITGLHSCHMYIKYGAHPEILSTCPRDSLILTFTVGLLYEKLSFKDRGNSL